MSPRGKKTAAKRPAAKKTAGKKGARRRTGGPGPLSLGREFTSGQFMLLEKASELYEKKAAGIATALQELGVPGLFLSSRRALITSGLTVLQNRTDDTPMAPSSMSARQRDAMRWAIVHYKGELTKLIKKETGLLVQTGDASNKMSALDVIQEMISDQLPLGTPVEVLVEQNNPDAPDGGTVSVDGGPAIPISNVDEVSQALRAALEKDLDSEQLEADLDDDKDEEDD